MKSWFSRSPPSPDASRQAMSAVMERGPRHIAIVMDGNGRWAQNRRLARTLGHARGIQTVRDLVSACIERRIECLTLFAFSTENWKRGEQEVGELMRLFAQFLRSELPAMQEAGVRLKVIGDLTPFPPGLQNDIAQAMLETEGNQRIVLTVAANYGGRWDIVQAARSWMEANPGRSSQDLTDAALQQHLQTRDLPALDLLIRTGGEVRLSNFLLWQSAYSELYFTDVLWPDFDASALDEALTWFASRTRRFGALG